MAFIKRLHLINFRNYQDKVFDFSPGINLIVGPNAIGKTNLLESIFLLASGSSFKAVKDEQMIDWQKDFSLIEAKTVLGSLKIKLIKNGLRTKKEFFIDGVKKIRKEFLSAFSAIVFQPEEIRLITGSPSRRRDALDQILSSLDWEYYRASLAYKKSLRRRNKLLIDIKISKASKQEMFYWDQSLVKNGELIRQKREEFFDFINYFFKHFSKESLTFLSCLYKPSSITLDRLKERLDFDLNRGITSIGPHRDDFSFISQEFKVSNRVDGRLSYWGSRGQQRMAILAFKLGQIAFVEKKQKDKPILLLDDIFSEFDQDTQKMVFSLIDNYQTLISSTDKNNSFLKQSKLIDLGQILA